MVSSSLVPRDRPILGLLAATLLLVGFVPEAVVAQDAEFVPDRVIVKYRPGATANRGIELGAAVGAQMIQQLPSINAEVMTVPEGWDVEETVRWYEGQFGVEYAEPDYLVYPIETLASPPKSLFGNTPPLPFATTPDDPRYSEQWALHNTGQTSGRDDADIDAPEAWDLTKGNDTIIVGVIDTGVQVAHPDLLANIWVNTGETAGDSIDNDGNGYVDDINGWDFANNDASVYDDPDIDDHGTHVAGTIGAATNNALGISGVAWNVKIMALKFLHNGGSTSNAITAIEYAQANGAHMTTNSWGGGGASQALQDAIEASGAAGMLFMAASGNSGLDADATPMYPAAYPSDNIVSVNATDHNDDLASFSNYGLTSTDMGAPGVAILSTIPDGAYASFSGTSMATPHVTGVAVLVHAMFPSLTHLEVKERLLWSGDPVDALVGKSVTGRRLNAYNALEEDSIPPNAVADLAVGPDPASMAITPLAGTSLRLQWTAPGDDGATGTAGGYDLRYATTAITDSTTFAAAMRATGLPRPEVAGTAQSVTVRGLDPETDYYFAIKSTDNVGNQSARSNSATGATGKVTVVFEDGAETSASDALWTRDAPWARTIEDASPSDATTPLGGDWSWTDSPGGQYGNGVNTSLTSNAISLLGVSSAILQFDHRYDIEAGWDYGYVEISTDGSSWTELEQYTGTQSTWTSNSIDLGAYDDQPAVLVRFRLATDGSVIRDGWYVDDVRVIGEVDAMLALNISLDASGDTALVSLSLDNKNKVVGLSYQLSWGNAANVSGNNLLSYDSSSVTARVSGLAHSVEVNTDTDVLTGILVDASGSGSIAAGDGAIIDYRFPLRSDQYATDAVFVDVQASGIPTQGVLPNISLSIPFTLPQTMMSDSVGNPLQAGRSGATFKIDSIINADVDMSGAVNVADIVSTIDFYLGRTQPSALQVIIADTYRDELLNVVDIVRAINIVLGRSIGTSSQSVSLLASGQQQGKELGRNLDVAVQSDAGTGSALVADIPAGVVGLELGIQHDPSSISDARLLLEDDRFEIVKKIGTTSSSFMIYSTNNSPLPSGTQPVLALELKSASGSDINGSGSSFYLSEVLGVDASGFPVYPSVDPMLAVQDFLGEPSLAPSQKLQLDRRGNSDGVYNLGDLLSLIHRAGLFPNNAGLEVTR